MTDTIALLIPALNPDRHLTELLKKLNKVWLGPIVLVDDGSDTDEAETIFENAVLAGCHLVRHEVNRGKGRALKTGFAECLRLWPDLTGVVTADADGQHLPEDICKTAEALELSPNCLVLGSRNFDEADIPARSLFGNKITRNFMKLFCDLDISDTQTGLRAIPADFMKVLADTYGEHFEFETNMLLEAKSLEINIKEINIATVYEEQNRASKFNPVKDSCLIYGQLLKYSAFSFSGKANRILLPYKKFISLFTAFVLVVSSVSFAFALSDNERPLQSNIQGSSQDNIQGNGQYTNQDNNRNNIQDSENNTSQRESDNKAAQTDTDDNTDNTDNNADDNSVDNSSVSESEADQEIPGEENGLISDPEVNENVESAILSDNLLEFDNSTKDTPVNIDGDYSDWEDFPQSDIGAEDADRCGGALYAQDDELDGYAYIGGEYEKEPSFDGSEFMDDVTFRFNNDCEFNPIFAAVDEYGNIDYYPDTDSLPEGEYRFYIMNGDDENRYYSIGEMEEAGAKMYGEAYLSVGRDCSNFEYRIDVDCIGEWFNREPNDFHDYEVHYGGCHEDNPDWNSDNNDHDGWWWNFDWWWHHDQPDDYWIHGGGSSTGPWCGTALCLGFTGIAVLFNRRKQLFNQVN